MALTRLAWYCAPDGLDIVGPVKLVYQGGAWWAVRLERGREVRALPPAGVPYGAQSAALGALLAGQERARDAWAARAEATRARWRQAVDAETLPCVPVLLERRG